MNRRHGPVFAALSFGLLSAVVAATLALPCLAATDPVKEPGVDPTWKKGATGTGVNIRLTEKKRIKRMHTPLPDAPGYDWLDGVLVVEILNLSSEPIQLEEFEAHNLAFVDVRSGRSYVLIHSCSCVAQCEAGSEAATFSRKSVPLLPGQSTTLSFEDFGCSGSMWVPPPEGVYDLYYRIRPYSSVALPINCPNPSDVKTTVDSCRAMLESDEFWKGAWTGQPLRLDLRKTHKKKL